MNKPIIAFIGAGNMAYSLISGLIADGYSPEKIWASDPSQEKLAKFQAQFKIHTTPDNGKNIAAADIIILAVKPDKLAQVLIPLREIITKKKPLIISIAAAIDMQHLQRWLSDDLAIVRCMPNTPALIQCGATGLFANPNVNAEQKALAESIMRAVGITVWLEQEKDINLVTILSGCGPAYFFLLMEMIQSITIELGLAPETAKLLTLQTALGAARLALESNTDPATLRRHVTSPNGTTERIINTLEAGNIRELFKQALLAGKAKTEELSQA